MIWIPKARVEDAVKLRDTVAEGQRIRANVSTGDRITGKLTYHDKTVTVMKKYRYGFMSKEFGFVSWNSAAICDQEV